MRSPVARAEEHARKIAKRKGRHQKIARWLVERFFAWIQWQRRILVRWEYHAQNFLGFVQLACLVACAARRTPRSSSP